MNDDTDRGWWVVVVVLSAWLFTIAFAVISWGVWAGVLAWAAFPLAIALGLAVWSRIERRRIEAAIRRHPSSGSRSFDDELEDWLRG